MTGIVRHTFPKAERLKSLKQIDLLFREGKSFFAAPVKCYYRFEVSGLQVDGLTGGKVEVLPGSQVEEFGSGLKSETANLKPGASAYPQTQNPEPETSNIKPETSNPKPQTTKNNKQQTINHQQQTPNIKTGVSVSKKNFKHSVDRNRIKRLMREAYRLHKHTLLEKLNGKPVTLEVFFVFTDRSLPTFALVEEKMKYCLRRLAKIAEGGS
jgi:ribonuclease P protein component